ncbi:MULTISPECIES: DUF6082 family protein [unclassified Streptomyces]|jgi:hypothetical protein|uniref:DUF6082 family protein n=1 Tax=unclassified Streptomyces TaxID=2593676 RepID=UPI001BB07DD5|nr:MULTISPECIES: DUF6082 family protein [unclassified Streptomyces]MDH6453431.1 hypothetical protein [Streptomyces sp. SAI-119]MDH6496014.1 hypothetical protein [Streptomyces sp. SAI-149]QUC57126.1 hypothetical protein IOD14_10160 [Streptomyces sp. A2-16]
MATQKSGKPGLDCVLAAGVAFTAGVLTALSARRNKAARHRSAEALRAENLRASLVDYQKLQLGLLERAIDDPELAAVLSTFEVESPTHLRQHLFANALYSNALFGYRIGVATMEELHGHLRVLCRSALFRKYWESTRPHRASLKDDSEEGRIGRMVDNLIRDLDEADTEEWWVVGEPPAD